MKLRQKFHAAVSDKATGKPDISLREHLEATNQTHLPQARILQEALDSLTGKDLIEEAYLRGSIGRGFADIHSDIDLFVVADPKDAPKVFDRITKYLNDNGGILTVCHDRLVADYGGIGFMFIARDGKDNNRLYQFDLYIAMKGVAPAFDFSIKPRVFARNPEYRWMREFGTPRDEKAIPPATQDFINRHAKGGCVEDKIELLAQEMLMTLFITDKHLKRNQISRTVVDNHAMMQGCCEMMQAFTGYGSTGYSPLYLGSEMADFCRKNGDAELAALADKFDALFAAPLDRKKLVDILDFTKDLFSKAYPERFAKHADAFAAFENDILALKKPATQKAPKLS